MPSFRPNLVTAVATSRSATSAGRPGRISGTSPATLSSGRISPVRASRARKMPPEGSHSRSSMAWVISSALRRCGAGSASTTAAIRASAASAAPYRALNSGSSTTKPVRPV
ncbi:hypothetical protein C1I98_07945 [Spongiactinospora gelatinilytica]|uniref:Uncharacterized protein n=1 Tax=Spongiactinospora gelatinilytica TaxID=2666298 RepID=A0A2W2GR28_9ACTN|nr:hypothetical protein C1I98_07945 [Spongiactinospora gelatinilytica]